MSIEINPFVERVVKSAMSSMQEIIVSGKEAVPQLWLLGHEKEKEIIMPLVGIERFFVNKEGKRLVRSVIKQSWEQLSAQHPDLKLKAVLNLSDSWIETVNDEEFEKIMRNGRSTPFTPKPGMGEAIVAVVAFADQELQYQWRYVRSDNEVIFGAEPKAHKNPEGPPRALFMGLWPI